ncbi:ribonuclease HII [Pseudomonas aeruginosa]|nr:ribonuclease HII [Pseudomonas aeruginosa]
MLAMQRAVEGLSVTPRLALIDGNRCPKLAVPCAPVVKGDSQVPAIAAASILAKVSRDREMVELDRGLSGLWHGRAQGISDRGPSRRRFPASARRRSIDARLRRFANCWTSLFNN